MALHCSPTPVDVVDLDYPNKKLIIPHQRKSI